MLRGSCLCGGVRYEITGPLSGALNCHCSMCRKAHGAAFRSRARVRAADFRWVRVKTLCRITSLPLARTGAFAASAVHLFLAGLTGTYRFTAFPLARSMTIRA